MASKQSFLHPPYIYAGVWGVYQEGLDPCRRGYRGVGGLTPREVYPPPLIFIVYYLLHAPVSNTQKLNTLKSFKPGHFKVVLLLYVFFL